MTTLPIDLAMTLETLVDRAGLQTVLQTLASVCFDKSIHIEHSWQDANTAKAWELVGQAIDAFAEQKRIKAVSR